MLTFLPGPHPLRTRSEEVVSPAQSMRAARAEAQRGGDGEEVMFVDADVGAVASRLGGRGRCQAIFGHTCRLVGFSKFRYRFWVAGIAGRTKIGRRRRVRAGLVG